MTDTPNYQTKVERATEGRSLDFVSPGAAVQPVAAAVVAQMFAPVASVPTAPTQPAPPQE
jgi:hypothetical protein